VTVILSFTFYKNITYKIFIDVFSLSRRSDRHIGIIYGRKLTSLIVRWSYFHDVHTRINENSPSCSNFIGQDRHTGMIY
jgi:hypothetical protein